MAAARQTKKLKVMLEKKGEISSGCCKTEPMERVATPAEQPASEIPLTTSGTWVSR